MSRHIVLLIAAGALLAACGTPQGVPAGPATTVPTGSASESSKRVPVVVTGTLGEGVEQGCLLLHPTDGGETLLLLGNLSGLTSTGTVTVRGVREPDLMTTCQQGVPFVVSDVL